MNTVAIIPTTKPAVPNAPGLFLRETAERTKPVTATGRPKTQHQAETQLPMTPISKPTKLNTNPVIAIEPTSFCILCTLYTKFFGMSTFFLIFLLQYFVMIIKFADNLKSLRINSKMTQQELAQLLNVDQRTISAWENKICEPDFETLANICEIFDEDFNDILT